MDITALTAAAVNSIIEACAAVRCRHLDLKGRMRCRMHGRALGSGAPKGKLNGRYNGGMFTKDAIQDRRELAGWLALVKATVKEV